MRDRLYGMHANVWSMRQYLSDVWPTPDMRTSLRFAATEAAEAVDAALRTYGHWARNNEKFLDPLEELGDCAMMLMTALGPLWNERWVEDNRHSTVPHVDTILAEVANINETVRMQGFWDEMVAERAIMTIIIGIMMHCDRANESLESIVDSRLERIKMKRLSKLTATTQ